MNPSPEQIEQTITEYERQAIIEESQRLERQADAIWAEYCYEHGILPRKPKPGLSGDAKFLIGFAALCSIVAGLVYLVAR